MKNKPNTIKKIVDVCMTIILIFLMAYQVTGEALHEWIGIGMTLTVIIHQILNRKWYATIFKGKYHPARVTMTAVNILLIASFLLTAFCGMSMSIYAVPFLYDMAPVSFVRRIHLSMSHWSFVLMGIHLGLHIKTMFSGVRIEEKTARVLRIILTVTAGCGFWLFMKNNMPDYLFFRIAFAVLDYEKAAGIVFLENIIMLLFWVVIGIQVLELIRRKDQKEKTNPLLPVVRIMATVIIGFILYIVVGTNDIANETDAWKSQVTDETVAEEPAWDVSEETGKSEDHTVSVDDIKDDFILVKGGSFVMGSPESENWRIEDEVQHEVSISSFFVDPYETTQKDYEQLQGTNPSAFEGDDLPVENISWLDAIRFANAKSETAGLTPVYKITEENVTWDRSANGYRLPTEAEWEYACRAETLTPFNTETSISTQEANYWGSYPYEIEENYFNKSALETKPGGSQGQTVSVGNYASNAFGLYDMHGNVNEWCWDYYGEYDTGNMNDPTGAQTGTRHVYRGGGWNDFAKNLRSAYRAAGQSDYKYSNLGVRLVRNADDGVNDLAVAKESVPQDKSSGKILIAFYSWGGNTRGIAKEIQKQTGADLYEITLTDPYSTDYNTVLMEAQEDQHKQARPEIANLPEKINEYDTILLGYPNWWASIPMPIATFLESYDFSGKTIVPFCSHGGGRFGQSLTAIAKLAPASDMGEGLAINYSGGASMPDDVSKWLDTNGIKRR